MERRSIFYQKPKYRKPIESEFKNLRKEVTHLVKQLEPQKQKMIRIKAILFPFLYFGTYALLLSHGSHGPIFYLCFALMGFFLLLNFLNLIHDAVHEVIFRSRFLNKMYVYFFDVLGANSYIWKIRHIQLHHSFPNIMGWDSDFEQSLIVRVFPQSAYKKIHRYQHLYLPFFYPLYLFNWLLVRDFKDFFSSRAIVQKVTEIPRREYVKLFFFKGFFLIYTLLIPKLVLGLPWGTILLGFVIMVFTASVFSLLVLLSPHANIHSQFPEQQEDGSMPFSWFMHQLQCTNDVSNDNFFIRFFMGSFNYHIAHHLFPNINHTYYPEVTKVIERFSLEHDLPYRKMSLVNSLKGHYMLLKTNSYRENIFEETM